MQKIVEKVREVPVLHMICGHIDGSRIDLPDTTFFYFMRTSDEGVPSFDTYEECLDEMPSYIAVGSLGGRFLASFNRMLVEVRESCSVSTIDSVNDPFTAGSNSCCNNSFAIASRYEIVISFKEISFTFSLFVCFFF